MKELVVRIKDMMIIVKEGEKIGITIDVKITVGRQISIEEIVQQRDIKALTEETVLEETVHKVIEVLIEGSIMKIQKF